MYQWLTDRSVISFVIGVVVVSFIYLYLKHTSQYKVHVLDYIPMKRSVQDQLKAKYKRLKLYGREIKCRIIVQNMLNVKFRSCRPAFLKNPKTGKNLELDMFNADLKLAFEVDGPQHFKYNPKYHKTYNDFVYQVQKDKFKDAQCKAHGIELVRIPYTISDDELDSYISSHLKRLGIVNETYVDQR